MGNSLDVVVGRMSSEDPADSN